MVIGTTIEQHFERFPHTTLPKKLGEPNYDLMQINHKLVATDAESVEKKN